MDHVRAYRDGKAENCPKLKFASRGLGDVVAKVTHATGIAQTVEAITEAVGVPCGCKERQERWNKAMPIHAAG